MGLLGRGVIALRRWRRRRTGKRGWERDGASGIGGDFAGLVRRQCERGWEGGTWVSFSDAVPKRRVTNERGCKGVSRGGEVKGVDRGKGKVTRGVARADAWTFRLHRGYRFAYRIRS